MSGSSRQNFYPWVGLALLWSPVWWRQHGLWQGDPEMVYGWAVPALVVFLLTERWRTWTGPERTDGRSGAERGLLWLALAAFPLTSLFLEAFPSWTAMLWGQAAVAAAITLVVLQRLLGAGAGRHFAFPVAFAFTALPWPAFVQQRLVPALTETIARLGGAVLNELGNPALVHGNVIEVTHAQVGIEEACSGIRSLQCAVMVGFFLGEYAGLSKARRGVLVAAAVGWALVANFGRVLFLALQATAGGTSAVAAWHDRAGDWTYVIAMTGTALAAWLLHRGGRRSAVVPSVAPEGVRSGVLPFRPTLAENKVAWLVGSVAVFSVVGAYAWFESNGAANAIGWTFRAPTRLGSYQPMPIPAESQSLLRCDRAEGATWSEPDGTRCATYFIHWGRGRSGESLTAMHNPLICLPAAGAHLISDRGLLSAQLRGRSAGLHLVDFEQNGIILSVAYTIAQSGVDPLAAGAGLAARWRAVRHRERGDEVQLLTVARWGEATTPPEKLRETLEAVVSNPNQAGR